MLMFPKPGKAAGPACDPHMVGIDALGFVASREELTRRFLDVTGLEVGQFRTEAVKPAFFVGLLDFLMANEADRVEFAGSAGLDPAEVRRAREGLAQPLEEPSGV